jgi:TrmH family RNA methyltransferase
METISSRRNAIVAEFRAAAERRRGDRHLLLDGVHLVEEARAAGLPLVRVAISAGWLEDPAARRIRAAMQRNGTRIDVVSERVMEALSPVRTPTGIVAVAEVPPRQMEQVLATATGLLLVAVDVQDPGNVGAIVRAAEAGGARGVIVAGASADPFGWKALRGSMGSAFRLPVAVERDPAEALGALRTRGWKVLATMPREGQPLYGVDLRGATAVLLGGEGPGLSRALAEMADDRIAIPMQSPVESLNVAVTAALIVYESWRQRHAQR